MRTTKILFLHGFFASGSCIPAQALKQAFAGKAEVLTPDLPLHPREALAFITKLCEREHPNVLVGNSNGSFLGQIVAIFQVHIRLRQKKCGSIMCRW